MEDRIRRRSTSGVQRRRRTTKIQKIRLVVILLIVTLFCYSITTTRTWAFLPTTRIRTISSPYHKSTSDQHVSLITSSWSTKSKDATKILFGGSENEQLETTTTTTTTPIESKKKISRISIIRCGNLAGMTNGQSTTTLEENNGDHHVDEEDDVIVLNFDGIENNNEDEDRCLFGNLVSITGETGSGKSLLVSKVADLVTGGKASVSLLQSSTATSDMTPPTATAEMVLSLYDESHISFVTKTLSDMDLDPKIMLQIPSENGYREITLRLKRTISLVSSNKGQQPRIKSNCFINDHLVSLKTLKAIASPLVAVVNAPVAAAALGQSPSRLSMIDNGIPPTVLTWVHQLQVTYRKRKKDRKVLQKEMDSQILPVSMMRDSKNNNNSDYDDKQLDLLRHWIDELDGFERRITDVQNSICSGISMQNDDLEIERLLEDLDGLDWMTAASTVSPDTSSMLYATLLDLHDYLKNLDARIIAATEARDSLASMSVSESARAALERTRQLLLDAGPQREGNMSGTITAKSRVGVATEKAHQMLNHVEDALSECATFLDDDSLGLLATLKATRRTCPLTTEGLLEHITEWNILARKHGISPDQLPHCHDNLRKELDGGVELGSTLLPEAKIAEAKALKELEEGCRVLTGTRKTLCLRISSLISRRLPRLGMENSKFEARLCPIENPTYSRSHLGAEEIDFYLLHDDQIIRDTGTIETKNSNHQIGGKVENVASSGEKARILLAIECEIPGSISALGSNPTESNTGGSILPVTVIYDEIDAHVGGRASIAVAQMLFDQSKSCQVLSITHSPSLAAIANTHICVRKGKSDKHGRLSIKASRVEGIERRKELARMASGDMAVEEAEVFAEALLRDASINTRE